MKYLFGYLCDGLVNESMIFLCSGLLSCHCLAAKLCLTLCGPMDYSLPVSSAHGVAIVVGCHFLLQGIFPSQGSNLYLLHWQVDSLPLSQGSPYSRLEVG